MTVRLLAALGQYPANAIVTFASAVETSLVSEKLAATDLTGGVVYQAPTAPARAGEAVRWMVDEFGAPVDLDLPGAGGKGGSATVLAIAGGSKRLKIVGRNSGWTESASPTAGTDIGGTCRSVFTAISPLSRLAGLMATHFWKDSGAGATEDTTTFPRHIVQFKLGFEYPLSGGHTSYSGMAGKPSFVIDPNSPVVQTDPVGVAIAAGSQFASRLYTKPANPPSGAGSAAAIAGGSLAAQTWYYVVTRTEMGVESGPTAEISATTASSNLAVAITITDTRSASADYYSIYRSSAAAGTKQFLGRTAGPAKRYVDDGSFSVDTTINPPVAANYRFNAITMRTGECTSHVNAGGVGDDQSGATGTFGIADLGFRFGVAPQCVVGDDTSGKSVLFTGDSVGLGAGFKETTGYYACNRNMFDVAIADGQFNTLNACKGGSTLAQMVAATTQGGGRSRMLLSAYADWHIDQHGTNDLGLGGTWQALAANKLLLGWLDYKIGVRFAITTITPRVTTTDACLTTANQTTGGLETNRRNFNTWCRNGCQVDGSGAPVLTGGTPSPYIQGVIDIAASVEVDASNTLTLNGGYWQVPVAPVVTAQTLTGSPSTTALAVSGTPYVAHEHVGRAVRITSGARAGQVAVVSDNTTSALTLFTAADTSQSGVAVAGLSGAPAAGDTFEILDTLSNEGLHPTIAGHYRLGSVAVAPWMSANIRGA